MDGGGAMPCTRLVPDLKAFESKRTIFRVWSDHVSVRRFREFAPSVVAKRASLLSSAFHSWQRPMQHEHEHEHDGT